MANWWDADPATAAPPPSKGWWSADPPADAQTKTDDKSNISKVAEGALGTVSSYPENYAKNRQAAVNAMAEGPKNAYDYLTDPKHSTLQKAAEIPHLAASGLTNAAMGAMGYVTSPINAAYESFVRKPVEKASGSPLLGNAAELAAQVMTPGMGIVGRGSKLFKDIPEVAPTVKGAPEPSGMAVARANQSRASEFTDTQGRPMELSYGEASNNPDAWRYEDTAGRGGYGTRAQNVAVPIMNRREDLMHGAAEKIGQELGEGTAKTPLDAAQLINAGLHERAGASREALGRVEQNAAEAENSQRGMIEDRERMLGDVVQGGQAPVAAGRDAGELVGESIRQRAADARRKATEAYTEAYARPGELHAGAVEGIGNRIKGALGDDVIIDDVTTPIASRAISNLDQNLSNLRIQNKSDPFGAPGQENIVAVNLKGVDQARKQLTQMYRAARTSGKPADARAMGKIIDAFDDHIEQSIANGLFTGDPEALDALKAARAQYRNYVQTYRPQGAGDDVGLAMRKIIDRNATPDETARMLTGSAALNQGLPVRLAQRIGSIFGKDSQEMSAIRQSLWEQAKHENPFKTSENIERLSDSTLGRYMFSPEERSALNAHAKSIRDIDGVVANLPERVAADRAAKAVDRTFSGKDIGGAPATTLKRIVEGSASPDEIKTTIFSALNSKNPANAGRFVDSIGNIFGRDSTEFKAMRQGVWQTITQKAEGMDRLGAQKLSQDILNFIGKDVAKKLYSTEELDKMRKFAEVVRLRASNKFSRTNSDTAPALGAMARKIGHGLMTVGLHKIPFASRAVEGLLGHLSDVGYATRVRKSLIDWDKARAKGGRVNRANGGKVGDIYDDNSGDLLYSPKDLDDQTKFLNEWNGDSPESSLQQAYIASQWMPRAKNVGDIDSEPSYHVEDRRYQFGPPSPPIYTGDVGALQRDNAGSALSESLMPPDLPPKGGKKKKNFADGGVPADDQTIELAPSSIDPYSGIMQMPVEMKPEHGYRPSGIGSAIAGAATDPMSVPKGAVEMVKRGLTSPQGAFTGEFQVTDPETGMPTEEAIRRSMDVAALAGGLGPGAAVDEASGVAQRSVSRAMEPEHSGVSVRTLDPVEREARRAAYNALMSDTAKPAAALEMFGGKPTYSAAGEAVRNAKAEVMHPQQWSGYLKNQPGIKPAELEHVGLEDWLSTQKGPLKKSDVESYIESKQPDIQEVRKGEIGGKFDSEDIERIAKDRFRTDPNKSSQLKDWENVPQYIRDNYLEGAEQELRQAYVDPTKYSQYQLPGGENYGESLLTIPGKNEGRIREIENRLSEINNLPAKETSPGAPKYNEYNREWMALQKERESLQDQKYKSSHWDEPNVLLHMRHNDRTLPNGDKSLHLEELQSDWHQAGRKNGYKDEGLRDKINSRTGPLTTEEQQAIENNKNAVPDAPFKQTWPDLGLKRMLHRAATERNPDGSYKYDALSWTPGQAQADRYSLSHHIDNIDVVKHGDADMPLWAWWPKNKNGVTLGSVTTDAEGKIIKAAQLYGDVKGKNISELVGKDVANRGLNTENKATLQGNDLQFGGEGMKGFYDKILVDKANALTKKSGAKVERSSIETNPKDWKITPPDENVHGKWMVKSKDYNSKGFLFDTKAEAEANLAQNIKGERGDKPIWKLPITPELRKAAEKGFTTFSDTAKPGMAMAALEGLPRKISVPGQGTIEAGPLPAARQVAQSYMEKAGLPYNPPTKYAKVNPEVATRIADEFEKMSHAPNDPTVKAAYQAMADETMEQWKAIKKAGLKVDFMPEKDPYEASPRLAIEDVKKNNHMYVYPTDTGFGEVGKGISAEEMTENPLLQQSGEKFSGKPARINDIFRVVHDYFGHAKEGVGFRADGEENAWRSHAAMYSPLARRAMTTETRGQNSWLNYGPHGEKNRTAKTADTVFAEQKVGLLPEWVSEEGMHDAPGTTLRSDSTQPGVAIADQLGIRPVPAQARQWTVYAPQTGVETAVGAPKLEILATQIMKTAKKLGLPPETVRDMVLKGKQYLRADGGRVNRKNSHITYHGLGITLENLKGMKRSGVEKNGKKWEVTMPAHYGFLKGSKGADDEGIDCYIGPNEKSKKIFVINQRDAETGDFDEHKCCLGFGTKAQVISTYLKGFSDGKGKKRLGEVVEMTLPEFRRFVLLETDRNI